MRWFAGMQKEADSKFGKFLKKHGLSIAMVAAKCRNVSDSTIGSWAKGGKNAVLRPVKKKADEVVRVLKELTGEDITYKDFWS